MNPDSFNNTNIIYKNIEMEQRKLGDLFWKKEYAKDYWIDIGDEKLYARLFISYPASKK
ncbi:hypothetical protein CMALT430_320024 [Carnobacterium maltaromaticum]|nr:hypothetical protein [Carnobacterium maltaromaticum]CAD5900469.1 hypothetical protein CMALT430_320024 [Carnobacterium maltaromaticum]